jgi:predicted TIM-barrel fold metal-dependent hydrolase
VQADERFIVISADCHGGADLMEYRDYLEPAYRDDFDRWAADYEIPYEDMKGEAGGRNWDSRRRSADLESDGIVAEVIFPNTVPPFFPTSSLASTQAAVGDAQDLARRWAGLRAHNRWLADFCLESEGRRAGVFQLMLHDIDEAVAEIRRAVDAGLRGGLLLPGAPPGSGLPPLYYHDYYDPLWTACEELGVPVNCHSGGAAPRTGDRPEDDMFFLLEMKWWDQRLLRHLILGGVLERHPALKVVFTESGANWIPRLLRSLDAYHAAMRSTGGDGEVAYRASHVVDDLSLPPSGYWRRQCYVGASFMHVSEVAERDRIGVDKIMWGSDYPHVEATFPYSRSAIRYAFAGVDGDEVTRMVGGNAAEVYGFSLSDLGPIAARVGPSRAEVAAGIDPGDLPDDAIRCPAFAGAMRGAATTHLGDNRRA